MSLTAATLSKAMGGSLSISRYTQLLPAFTDCLRQANCNTVNRVAMLCAQVGHESAGLRYMEELASGAEYNGRRDLGNTQPGDGPRFKGRGPIQITGRANYTTVSKWAHGKSLVPTATYFVDNPSQLASDKYGFIGVVWYWTVARNMNSYADRGDILGATKAVNGGTNGYQDRLARWNSCRKLGNALLPGSTSTKTSTAKPAAKTTTGTLYHVTTKAGLFARKSPNGANVIKNGKKLLRPYRFTIKVVATKTAGGKKWAKGSGGLWYAADYLAKGKGA